MFACCRASTIFLLLLVGRVAIAAAQPRVERDSAVALRHEAVNILQGVDTAPFLDPARIAAVAKALRIIRAEIPRLAAVRNHHDRTWFSLTAADSVRGVFVRGRKSRDSWTVNPTLTGVRAIDSLNRLFGVTRATVSGGPIRSYMELEFRRPIDVRVVARSYRRIPQLSFAGWFPEPGDGNWIEVIPKGPKLHFVFALGGGDCPAGCTQWEYYYVTYNAPDSTVALERSLLHGTAWSEPIFYWDTPSRYSINPYPTIDNIFAGTRDTRWWYRKHAIDVLAILLGPAQTTPYGEQSREHFAALKREAMSRRRDSYGALIERLGDNDPDVARLAHGALVELSGQKLPGGGEGMARWREWLNRSR